MTSEECEKCLSDILAGNSEGLRRIYSAYYKAVFALSLSILGDYHKAEDAAQDVFLKIWSGVGSYRFGENPKAWIMAITRNLSLDCLRREKHETPDEAIEDTCGESSDCIDDFVTDKLELEQALKSLPDTEREIFVMHFAWDASYITISHMLKMPLATVAWKCARSVKTMQKILMK
jgi:RNA polymerase sigma-70 factor (ECF subfamily)